MVRNRMWRRIELAEHDDVDGIDAMTPGVGGGITVDYWDDALGVYWDEYGAIGMGTEACGLGLLMAVETGRVWQVCQIFDDPENNHNWQV